MTTGLQSGSALADELLQRIGGTIGDRATVATVFGEPVERNGTTVIPVARARFAFGGGGGGGSGGGEEGSGGGGGGGAVVSPAGYIELRAGGARFQRISGSADLVAFAVVASLAALALKRLLGG